MGHQELFVYSSVGRRTVIFSEYKAVPSSNFAAVAAECLQTFPSSNSRFTVNRDNHSFNFIVDECNAYCVVAKESVSKQLCFAFLDRTRDDFGKTFGGSEVRGFWKVMKGNMEYVAENAEEIDKLMKEKAQVSQVQNIDKAHEYKRRGTEIRQKMWYQNMKMKLILLGILLILVLIKLKHPFCDHFWT